MSSKLPATMNVIEMTRSGGPEVLKLAQRPVPGVKPDEVLIEVEATGGIRVRRQAELGERAAWRHAAVGELAEHAIGFVEGDQHGPHRFPRRGFGAPAAAGASSSTA